MRYQGIIQTKLRDDILDPAGNASLAALHRLGFQEADNLRIGKTISLSLQAENETVAREKLEAMCENFLVNKVVEDYDITLSKADQ